MLKPWPDPDIYGATGYRISDAAVYAFIFALLVWRTTAERRVPRLGYLYFWQWFLFVAVLVSILWNLEAQGFRDFAELYRPIYILTTCGLFWMYASRYGTAMAFRQLYYGLMVVCFVQLPVMMLQLYGHSVIEGLTVLYASHKVEVGAMRATGTMGNPNHLAFVLIAGVVVNLIGRASTVRVICGTILGVGVLLTGSLSATVIGAIAIGGIFAVKAAELDTHKSVVVGSLGVLTAGMSAVFLWPVLLETFPRLSRLGAVDVRDAASILTLRNLAVRMDLWEQLITRHWDGTVTTFLFGVGPSKNLGLAYADNEWLFVFLRHGVVGILAFVGFLLWMFGTTKGQRHEAQMYALTLFLVGLFLTPMFEVYHLNRTIPLFMCVAAIALVARQDGGRGAVAFGIRPQYSSGRSSGRMDE